MPDELSEERLQLLADIAEMYYLGGLSQEEIASRVNLSRPSISRLLLEARQLGILEITINRPIPTVPALASALQQAFSLRDVRVLERKTSSEEEAQHQIGRLGVAVLDNVLQDGMILGMAWGTAVNTVVRALRPRRLPRVKVVQVIGGVGAPYRSIDGPEQARRAGEMFGAQHFYLNAPLYVDNPEVAAALREDHSIKEVLELARQADVVLLGIGAIQPEVCTPFHAGYLTYEDLRHLDKDGVAGIMCASNYSIEGEFLRLAWIEDCAIGINADDFDRFGTVVAVASERRKAAAILGALRTGTVDILITDDATAEEVLALMEREPVPEQSHAQRGSHQPGR